MPPYGTFRIQAQETLVESSTGRVLQSTLDGHREPPDRATLVVEVAPDYEVRGWGPERLGVRSGYVPTLATAVVRAWESQQLTAEQERSARLAEVDRACATLLASVGHDLRTPLAGIRVSAEALAMSDSSLSDADRVELLDGLRQSAIRLDEVIGAVLDASRIEAGVLHVDRFTTDVGEVAARALHQLASPRVHLHGTDGPVLGCTDPALLERIVANLVSNALAHTPEDTPVEVILAQDGRTATAPDWPPSHRRGPQPPRHGPARAHSPRACWWCSRRVRVAPGPGLGGPGPPRHVHDVRIYVNALRKKLEPDPSHTASILSQPGRGYRLVATTARAGHTGPQ